MAKRILFIDDLAELLNTTVFSIRSHLQRKNYRAIPMPIRLGRRLAWTSTQIDEFLAAKEAEAAARGERSDRGPGRPRKSIDEQY